MCDCVEKMKEKSMHKAKQTLSEKNNVVVKSPIERLISLDGSPVTLFAEFIVTYQKFKANGEPYRNRTREHIRLHASYCMYCGEKQK